MKPAKEYTSDVHFYWKRKKITQYFIILKSHLLYIVRESHITMQSNAIQCNPVQSNAMQSNPIQSNTIQYNTIQYNINYL